MFSQKTINTLLNYCLTSGADYAEFFFDTTEDYSLVLENGIFENSSNYLTEGVGIRLIKGNQTVYGYTNLNDVPSLKKLIKQLKDAFKTNKYIKKNVNGFKITKTDIYKSTNLSSKTPKIKIFNLLKDISLYIKNKYKKIVKNKALFHYETKKTEIINSKGIHSKSLKEYSVLSILATAKDKEIIENDSINKTSTTGFDYFLKTNWAKIADSICINVINNLYAKPCPSGKMPVIVGNGFGGVLFHEACGHSLEGPSLIEHPENFFKKLNKRISSPLLTVYEDGTIPNEWGTIKIDDEGNDSKKVCLIHKGILKNFILDDFSAKKLKMTSNGKCRREDYRKIPTSRMTNTYIDNGTSTPEEIIKSTKLGLYAKNFSGGSVNTSTGQFNFGANEAYIIRNGKICERVKGAIIIGKAEDILNKIDMIGNDLKLSQGYCGASSGTIPVCVGQPTLRIKNISVGGTGGKLK